MEDEENVMRIEDGENYVIGDGYRKLKVDFSNSVLYEIKRKIELWLERRYDTLADEDTQYKFSHPIREFIGTFLIGKTENRRTIVQREEDLTNEKFLENWKNYKKMYKRAMQDLDYYRNRKKFMDPNSVSDKEEVEEAREKAMQSRNKLIPFHKYFLKYAWKYLLDIERGEEGFEDVEEDIENVLGV